jgi:hypothetical protein
MMPFEKCPVCGGEMVGKEVEKLLRGGVNTAVLRVPAEVIHNDNRKITHRDHRKFPHLVLRLIPGLGPAPG